MEYIRLLHHRNFDPRKNRFNRLAFKNYGRSGSVIQHLCVQQNGTAVCAHIQKYYAPIAGSPAIFWLFSDSQLPPGGRFVQEPSKSGDECHYNIYGITDDQYAEFIKEHQINRDFAEFYICLD